MLFLFIRKLISIHIPLVPILGLIYFCLKFLVDLHLVLNLFKSEIESSGELIHNASLKVISILIFYQLCIFVKLLSDKSYKISFLLLLIILFTLIVYLLYSKEFIQPEMFKKEDNKSDNHYLQKWYNKYSHPMTKNRRRSRFQ